MEVVVGYEEWKGAVRSVGGVRKAVKPSIVHI